MAFPGEHSPRVTETKARTFYVNGSNRVRSKLIATCGLVSVDIILSATAVLGHSRTMLLTINVVLARHISA